MDATILMTSGNLTTLVWMFNDLWSQTPQHIPLGKTWMDLHLRDFGKFCVRVVAAGVL